MHTCLALICIFFANKWTTGLKRKEAELFLLHMLSYGGPAVAERSWLCAHRLIAENIASRKQKSQWALAQNCLHICKWSGTTLILCRCFIAPCSKIRSFESNYAVLMKVLACRWGFSAPPQWFGGWGIVPLCHSRYGPGCWFGKFVFKTFTSLHKPVADRAVTAR